MGQIFVEFDNQLKQSDIIVTLQNSSKDEAGEYYEPNKVDVQQTSVYGIQAPIVQINNTFIDCDKIINFSLKSINELPEVSIEVRDDSGYLQNLDSTGMDNELRIQILPKFDEAYKKINLTFYLDSIRINNNIIKARGVYKVPKFTSSQFKAFGEVNTYDLFKLIATDTGLGFATNTSSNDGDKRYVYCPYKSYKNILDEEISRGGSSMEIYDYWVDFWNNINLVDIYDRYNNKDKEDDMQIWIANQMKEMGEGSETIPYQTLALLTNLPLNQSSELYIKEYQIHNNSGSSVIDGTDKVLSIYKDIDKTHTDTLVQDGDIKKDIFLKYNYLGEVWGEYDYLLQPHLRKAFLQKINSETVEVTLEAPLLGLMRGHKVNIGWYITDEELSAKKEVLSQVGILNDVQTDLPIPEDINGDETNGKFELDKKVSGQYLIIGCNIKYTDEKWSYTLILSRPAQDKPKILIEEENGE